jgi:hypothetical protein
MDATETMLAIEEIKNLKSRYFRSLDTKNEVLYRSVVTDDFIFDAPGIITDPVTGYSPYLDPSTEILRGRDMCARSIFAAINHPDFCSVHLGHMPDIEIVDPENAKGVWSMSDVVNFPRGDGTRVTLLGYGYYHDSYRREDRVWKIASVKLTRIRVDYPFEEVWRGKTRAGSPSEERLSWLPTASAANPSGALPPMRGSVR